MCESFAHVGVLARNLIDWHPQAGACPVQGVADRWQTYLKL